MWLILIKILFVYIMKIFDLLSKPEYIALLISVIAICINVYISWRNRKYALAKEEYFKLQQIIEKINAKLLILENHREKLKVFFEQSFYATQKPEIDFIDISDTFNKSIFEKDSEEIAALIDIYFSEINESWNFCLEKMSELFVIVFALDVEIKREISINWKQKIEAFNKASLELGNRPKEISDAIKNELNKFKEKNLK